MRRILITLAVLASYPLIAAGSCATTGGAEPKIRTVEVRVPVPVPCPDARAAAPAYPDSRAAVEAALARKDPGEALRLLLAAWPLHYQRHAEDDAQIAACARPPPAPG